MKRNASPRARIAKGFTLVEIMIVVVIIGVLAALAIPAFGRVQRAAKNARFANDLRQARDIFEVYALENGAYAADGLPAVVPAGMGDLLARLNWTADTAIGGQWDWDFQQFGFVAGVSVYRPTVTQVQMAQIDADVDDGNLATGHFRQRTDGYIYILE